jgi:hypothetical protein
MLLGKANRTPAAIRGRSPIDRHTFAQHLDAPARRHRRTRGLSMLVV